MTDAFNAHWAEIRRRNQSRTYTQQDMARAWQEGTTWAANHEQAATHDDNPYKENSR